MKYKLDEKGEIDQGGASHLIFTSQNGQSIDIMFLMTSLRKNVEAEISGHISMFKKSLQLFIITLVSKSCINCRQIFIPEDYKVGTVY